MSKRSLVMFFIGAMAMLSFAIFSTPAHAEGIENCNSPKSYLQVVSVSNASATVKNTSESCSTSVGMASYKKFDSNIDHQILFSSDTKSIGPGQTVRLFVSLPGCATQVDLFWGSLITSFKGGIRYGYRLLWSTHLGGKKYCTNKPTPDKPGVYVPETKVCHYSTSKDWLVSLIGQPVTFYNDSGNQLQSNKTFVVLPDGPGLAKVDWVSGSPNTSDTNLGIIKVYIGGVYTWTWNNCNYVPPETTQKVAVSSTVPPTAPSLPVLRALTPNQCKSTDIFKMIEKDRNHAKVQACIDPIVKVYYEDGGFQAWILDPTIPGQIYDLSFGTHKAKRIEVWSMDDKVLLLHFDFWSN